MARLLLEEYLQPFSSINHGRVVMMVLQQGYVGRYVMMMGRNPKPQHKTLAKNESRQSCGERQSFEAYEGTGCRFAHAKKLELVHFYGGRLVEKSDAPTPNN